VSQISNPSSFWHEAQFQRVCAVCHGVGPFDAHHVVDKQTLRRQGLQRNDLYDTRNALRLCSRFGNNCHFQHENRRRIVKTGELLDRNIEYAWEVLGSYAVDFLRREYDDSAGDPRIAKLESRRDGA
jgi:hypothetical protein